MRKFCIKCKKVMTSREICGICNQKEQWKSPFKESGTGLRVTIK